jgi:PadR family transcriptional regulator
MSKSTGFLGELEQVVLLALLRLGDEAYAVPLLQELRATANRTLSRGALYTVLDRLEGKGMLRSRYADPATERGGRPRRYFRPTAAAIRALRESRRTLTALWQGIDALAEKP